MNIWNYLNEKPLNHVICSKNKKQEKELIMKKVFFSIVFTLAILVSLMVVFSAGVSADPGHGPDGYSGFGKGERYSP